MPEEELWVKPPVEAVGTERKLFHSERLGRDVSYVIYLPRDYADGDRRYPVLYWLHGRGGSQTGIPGMVERWDRMIADGQSPPMIVVFVNGLSLSSFEDSADGKLPVETVSIQELIPHIDATYRTIATREGRAIEGFSMGGSGAAEWGFKYPDLFGAVSILAGALFDGTRGPPRGKQGNGGETTAAPAAINNPFELVRRNADQIRGRTPIRIVVGGKDGLSSRNRAYHELLDELDIPHTFDVVDGAIHAHQPLYDAQGEKNGAFYRSAFERDAPTDAQEGQSGQASTIDRFELRDERWTCMADGRPLSGILVSPRAAGKYPAILLSHGLGGSAEGLLPKARALSEQGFVCVATDYTHAGPGKATNFDNGASPENVRRALACLAILTEQGNVDDERLAAWGFSMGALLTIALAAEEPERLRAAAIVAGGVQESPERLYPSVAQARRIRAPFFIVSGEADERVAPATTDLLARILEANGVPHERRVVEGANHRAALSDAAADAAALAWLKSQLGVSDAAASATDAPRPAMERGGRNGQGATPARQTPVSTWVDPDRTEPEHMRYKTFESRAAGGPVSYLIYLPGDHETDLQRRYPVVYWLHGRGGNQRGCGGVVALFDAAIRDGRMPPIIVVGVNGLSFSSYVDSADGKTPVRSVIVDDLVAHIDDTYPTIARREARAIEGFSMGGAGAAKIGFRHPEVFGVVSVLAGALHDLESMRRAGDTFDTIYGGDEAYFKECSPWEVIERNADAIRGRTKVRVIVGAADGLLARNQTYHELAERLGIEHEFTIIPNAAHNAGQLYTGLGEAGPEFYKRAFDGVE